MMLSYKQSLFLLIIGCFQVLKRLKTAKFCLSLFLFYPPVYALQADGQALIFDPDPRTVLQNEQLYDLSPAAEFENAYQTKILRGLRLDEQGCYHLEGEYVRLVDVSADWIAPSVRCDGVWSAKRGEQAFNDVMSYYHIDQNQRYLQSLGFTGAKAIPARPINVDANAHSGANQSSYDKYSHTLLFGHGGVDDNEDADVILHEYCHALIHAINPRLNDDVGDMGAISEGVCDYWAASYSYSTPSGAAFHPEWVFSWDAHGQDSWYGRRLDRLDSRYNPAFIYHAHAIINKAFFAEELWSTPLFQALLELNQDYHKPRAQMDKIIIESLFKLQGVINMPDAAQAIIDTAEQLQPLGVHSRIYRQHFIHHAILTLPQNSALGFKAGKNKPSTAQFSLFSRQYESYQVIDYFIKTEELHYGKTADILLIAMNKYDPQQQFMRVKQVWQPWDGQVAHLEADRRLRQLPVTLSGEFYRGEWFDQTNFRLFYAYRLLQGEIIYNQL